MANTNCAIDITNQLENIFNEPFKTATIDGKAMQQLWTQSVHLTLGQIFFFFCFWIHISLKTLNLLEIKSILRVIWDILTNQN